MQCMQDQAQTPPSAAPPPRNALLQLECKFALENSFCCTHCTSHTSRLGLYLCSHLNLGSLVRSSNTQWVQKIRPPNQTYNNRMMNREQQQRRQRQVDRNNSGSGSGSSGSSSGRGKEQWDYFNNLMMDATYPSNESQDENDEDDLLLRTAQDSSSIDIEADDDEDDTTETDEGDNDAAAVNNSGGNNGPLHVSRSSLVGPIDLPTRQQRHGNSSSGPLHFSASLGDPTKWMMATSDSIGDFDAKTKDGDHVNVMIDEEPADITETENYDYDDDEHDDEDYDYFDHDGMLLMSPDTQGRSHINRSKTIRFADGTIFKDGSSSESHNNSSTTISMDMQDALMLGGVDDGEDGEEGFLNGSHDLLGDLGDLNDSGDFDIFGDDNIAKSSPSKNRRRGRSSTKDVDDTERTDSSSGSDIDIDEEDEENNEREEERKVIKSIAFAGLGAGLFAFVGWTVGKLMNRTRDTTAEDLAQQGAEEVIQETATNLIVQQGGEQAITQTALMNASMTQSSANMSVLGGGYIPPGPAGMSGPQ